MKNLMNNTRKWPSYLIVVEMFQPYTLPVFYPSHHPTNCSLREFSTIGWPDNPHDLWLSPASA